MLLNVSYSSLASSNLQIADSILLCDSSCIETGGVDTSSDSYRDALESYNDTLEGGGGTDNPLDTDADPLSTWLVVVWALLAAGTSFVTVSGNLIVLLSFFLERSIRQPTNYFIASLAMSDLLIGAVSMPFYSVYLLKGEHWSLGEFLCDLWLSVDYTACLCSIYTVLCITIDRFCSVKLPAKYREWRSERKVICVVGFTWILPAMVFFPSIFGWQSWVGVRTVPDGKCYVQYMDEPLFNCFLQIGYFWVTLIVMCSLYTAIYQVALNLQQKSDRKYNLTSSFVTLAGQRFAQIGIGMTDSTRGTAIERETMRLTEVRENEPCPARGAGTKGRAEDRDSCGSSPEYPSDTEMTPATPMILSNVTRFLGHPLSLTAHAVLQSGTKPSSNTRLLQTESKPTYETNDVRQRNQDPAKASGCVKHYKTIPKHFDKIVNDKTDRNLDIKDAKPYLQLNTPKLNDSEQSLVDNDQSDTELLYNQRKTNYCPANNILLDKVRSIATTRYMNGPVKSASHDCHDQSPSQYEERSEESQVWKRRESFCESYSILSLSTSGKQYSSIAMNKNEQINMNEKVVEPQPAGKRPLAPIAVLRLRLRLTTKYRSSKPCRSTPDLTSHHISSESGLEPDKLLALENHSQQGPQNHLVIKPQTAEQIELQSMTQIPPVNTLNTKPNGSCGADKKVKIKNSFIYKSLVERRGFGRSSGTHCATATSGNLKSRRANRARKALRTITIILGTFVCCWTPWHVLSMIIGFCSAEDRVCIAPALYDFSYYLCYLNSPLNPFCYALANKQFKNAFTRILRLDWHIS